MSDKDSQATEVVKRYAIYAAAAGLIPVPLLDVAAISSVELMMAAELAKVYDVPFAKDKVRPLVAALVGGYAATAIGHGVGTGLVRSIPGVGGLLGLLSVPAFGAGVTWAIGKIFIQHFASGGTFLDFDPDEVQSYFQKNSAAAGTAA